MIQGMRNIHFEMFVKNDLNFIYFTQGPVLILAVNSPFCRSEIFVGNCQ